jgi:hypothetical protein
VLAQGLQLRGLDPGWPVLGTLATIPGLCEPRSPRIIYIHSPQSGMATLVCGSPTTKRPRSVRAR